MDQRDADFLLNLLLDRTSGNGECLYNLHRLHRINPRTYFSLGYVESAALGSGVELGNNSVGSWQQSLVRSDELYDSGIPGLTGAADPSAVVFNGTGTYTLSVEILGVVSGSNPTMSVLVTGVNLSAVVSVCGLYGASSLSIAGVVKLGSGNTPSAIGVDPNTDTVYVANPCLLCSTNGALWVINGTTNTVEDNLSIKYITYLSSIAVDPSANLIYVAANASASCVHTKQTQSEVAVVDGSNDSVLRYLTVEQGPSSMVVDHATDTLYLSHYCGDTPGPAEVTAVNATTGETIANVQITKFGATWSLALDSITDTIWAAEGGIALNEPLTAVNGTTNKVEANINLSTGSSNPTIRVASDAVTVDAATDMVYATDVGPLGILHIINGKTDKEVGNTTIGEAGDFITVDPVSDKVYVVASSCRDTSYFAPYCTYRLNTVYAIDGRTGEVTGNLTLEAGLSAVAVNPTTGLIYVGGPGAEVTVVKDSAQFSASTSSSKGGSSIPEFPYQVVGATVIALGVVLAYIAVKARTRAPSGSAHEGRAFANSESRLRRFNADS